MLENVYGIYHESNLNENTTFLADKNMLGKNTIKKTYVHAVAI